MAARLVVCVLVCWLGTARADGAPTTLSGRVTDVLGEPIAGARIDLSPAMIEEARASHPGIEFRVGDMFALPFEGGTVGGIVAFYSIVHVRSDELVAPFREMYRVLAPGGLLAVAFHVGTETVHVDELFGSATSLDFVLHRPEPVAAALVEAGFTIEARLDREPYEGVEHPSQTYLLARR